MILVYMYVWYVGTLANIMFVLFFSQKITYLRIIVIQIILNLMIFLVLVFSKIKENMV